MQICLVAFPNPGDIVLYQTVKKRSNLFKCLLDVLHWVNISVSDNFPGGCYFQQGIYRYNIDQRHHALATALQGLISQCIIK